MSLGSLCRGCFCPGGQGAGGCCNGGFCSGDAAFLWVAVVLSRVPAMGGCCPCATGQGRDHAGARTPLLHLLWHGGGLSATHPGDTVTIETTTLPRVGKRCDSSTTCLVQNKLGGSVPVSPMPGRTPKVALGMYGTRSSSCSHSRWAWGLHTPMITHGTPSDTPSSVWDPLRFALGRGLLVPALLPGAWTQISRTSLIC